MARYNSSNLTNIKTIIEKKAGVSFAETSRGHGINKSVVLAVCVFCVLSLSAFSFYKFSSINGDDLVLSSFYLGDGKYEIIVTNMSKHELKLQDSVRVMQWTTGQEVFGKSESIGVKACTIAAGESGVVKIDISNAYDVDKLKADIKDNDWYYFVLTNNRFAFGQDWMCAFDFNIIDEGEAIAIHDSFVESVEERTAYIPVYEEGVFIFNDWSMPVKDMKISGYFGEQANGVFSDHINIAGIEGEEIYAVTDGTIIDTGFDSIYGNYVVLVGENNTIITYGHLKSVCVLKADTVVANTVIGYMGKTGMATGPNLSLAVNMDGEYINPIK